MQQELHLGPPIFLKAMECELQVSQTVFLKVYKAAISTGYPFHGTSAIWLSSVRLCAALSETCLERVGKDRGVSEMFAS